MSFYKKAFEFLNRYISTATLYKYGFNYSPMYRRSTGKIIYVSKDLSEITVKIPISWKNRNYMNSVFGGSMFSAVDPIPMIQLMNLLGDEYIVWDKSSEISFRRPARENLFAKFHCGEDELQAIIERVKNESEIEYVVTTQLTNRKGEIIYCEVRKKLYIAKKEFYQEKQINRLKNRDLA